jgi:hypothetical protein
LFAFASVIASEVLGVIVTFTLKTDVINSCTAHYTGSTEDDGSIFGNGNSNSGPLSATDANNYCQSLWSSDRTWDIVWLFVSLFLGSLFVMFSFAYVRQLLDPSSVRVRINRFQQQSRPQQHGMNGPYDPEAAFSYPPNSASAAMYPPPPGPPPSGPGAPPLYSGRGSMDDWDDAKSPTGYGYGYNYGPGEREYQTNRAGSSRNVAMHPDDEHEQEMDRSKRDSAETLRGEESGKKLQSTIGHGRPHDNDDDDAPRI